MSSQGEGGGGGDPSKQAYGKGKGLPSKHKCMGKGGGFWTVPLSLYACVWAKGEGQREEDIVQSYTPNSLFSFLADTILSYGFVFFECYELNQGAEVKHPPSHIPILPLYILQVSILWCCFITLHGQSTETFCSQ